MGPYLFIIVSLIILYFLENLHFQKKKTGMVNTLTETYKAEPLSEDVMKFKLGGFDIYTEIFSDSKFGLQLASFVIIYFHIPRDQFDRVLTRDASAFTVSEINGIQTYIVYQTHPAGLKHAKRKLKEIILNT
jgi:hypothetical protein